MVVIGWMRVNCFTLYKPQSDSNPIIRLKIQENQKAMVNIEITLETHYEGADVELKHALLRNSLASNQA